MRVRAIIPYNDRIVLVKRTRIVEGRVKEYFVFPGGGVEGSETLEECIKREVFEEIGIVVDPFKEIYRVRGKREEVFFLCKYVSGEFGTGKGPEFNSEGYRERGTYEIVTVPTTEISSIDLLPLVQVALVEDLKKYGSLEGIQFRELS